jgi:DNA repair protein RecN (Recombination protein N)
LHGVIKIQDELSGRLSGLTNLSAREQSLKEALEGAQVQYRAAAQLLTERRKEAAPRLERRVMEDLAHVALEQARFIVQIETAEEALGESPGNAFEPDGQTIGAPFFTPRGADRVEFLLSANPGETPRPLARIASGGELSRLMLTLRTAGTAAQPTGDEETCGTVVFDEVDVGIGGRVAEAVGRRLKMLAQARQVLCVTHQAQIARFADQHFVVEKSVRNGRTITMAKKLSAEERVSELVRMIGGAEDLATTRETARWLLENSDVKGLRAGRRRV